MGNVVEKVTSSLPGSTPDPESLSPDDYAEQTEKLWKKYRSDAEEHARKRSQYYEEAAEAHKRGEGAKAKELSEKGKEEGRLIEEANKKAAKAIFKAKNKGRPVGTVDLHGLTVKEAEMIVEERIQKGKRKGWQTLNIITGAGHHSGAGGPKIRPAICKVLSDNRIRFEDDPTNKSHGAITAYLS